MQLRQPRHSLVPVELESPAPGPGQLSIRVQACGVCRTDLHVFDGELAKPRLPLILGHEVVGQVLASGPGASRFALGTRVGAPWLGWTCGVCRFCTQGRENLCPRALFTGRSVANLTRRDAEEFLPLAARIPVETSSVEYALLDANRALAELRAGAFQGAAVLRT